MGLSALTDEYENNGRLSRRSIQLLSDRLLSDDPYEAITVSTDCAAFELVPKIAKSLDSPDPMVRWNAVASLHTRFRVPDCIEKTLKMASEDEDTMVRAIALHGVGEMLPIIRDQSLRRKMASLLITTLDDAKLFNELRAAAYEGILAAMDVLPLDRPPATKPLNLERDVESTLVQQFKNCYLEGQEGAGWRT